MSIWSGVAGAINVVRDSLLGSNRAEIFDSSVPPGEDEDLGAPYDNFGAPRACTEGIWSNDTRLINMLILVEDLVANNSVYGVPVLRRDRQYRLAAFPGRQKTFYVENEVQSKRI